jgi:hypothetical protein
MAQQEMKVTLLQLTAVAMTFDSFAEARVMLCLAQQVVLVPCRTHYIEKRGVRRCVATVNVIDNNLVHDNTARQPDTSRADDTHVVLSITNQTLTL